MTGPAEDLSLSEFDNAPGKTVSSESPPNEGGLKFDIDPTPPEEPTLPDQPVEAEAPEPTDLESLQAQVDDLAQSNETLRSSTGRLGTQLAEKDAQLRMFQQMQQQQAPQAAQLSPGADLVDPDTRAYIDSQMQLQQQQTFLLETMKTDMSFKGKVAPTAELDQRVQAHQMFTGAPSWKVAYNDLLADGLIQKPTAEVIKPPRKVAVQPKTMPIQGGGTPRSPSAPLGDGGLNIDMEKFANASDAARAALLRKVGEYDS